MLVPAARQSRWNDGLDADRVVDDLEEVRLLRGIGVVDEKARGDLPPLGVEHVPRVGTSDAPSPRDHLPPVPVIAEQLDYAFHPRFPTSHIAGKAYEGLVSVETHPELFPTLAGPGTLMITPKGTLILFR